MPDRNTMLWSDHGSFPGRFVTGTKDRVFRLFFNFPKGVPVLISDCISNEAGQIERSPTQAEIAAHLDISDRRLRELLTEFGLDHKAVPLAEIRVRYLRKLREEAAGRSAQGNIDLPTERALLARAQREGQEIKNEVARGTYAAIESLTDVLASASQAVVDHLDQISAGIARVCPDLPQSVRNLVMGELARARNEMVRKTATLIADALDAGDIQDEEVEPLSPAEED
jgi:phage terminase Nu1 subunit (DNA packaging protein)